MFGVSARAVTSNHLCEHVQMVGGGAASMNDLANQQPNAKTSLS